MCLFMLILVLDDMLFAGIMIWCLYVCASGVNLVPASSVVIFKVLVDTMHKKDDST